MSLWFPRLASDRALRARPVDGPFALTLRHSNTDRLYCLNRAAEQQGLNRGMSFSDARAFCPDLQSRPADMPGDAGFLRALARWATRYCPWVGLEGGDGLVLDVTGAVHLWGDEARMLCDMRQRLARAGLFVQAGLADTRGAAWALAHYGEGCAAPGESLGAIADLPVTALRLEADTVVALQRVGIRRIDALAALPRASLARRFGRDVLMRLDQALGAQPEHVSPLSAPVHYGVRMTLPDPIGLAADVMAVAERLLDQLCAKLKANETGARILRLTLRRVDGESQQVELRLARPLREPPRILSLFRRGVDQVDAGFGIDQMRLEAVEVAGLPVQQLSPNRQQGSAALDDLITRIGTRIGLENVQRFLPADSHIPERSFLIAPAAYSEPEGPWLRAAPRPAWLFPPEPIVGEGRQPPAQFRWRRMPLTTGRARGPERIAPEWWFEDESWHRGLRDYWLVETRQGRRLWLFHTPQNPGWFVQGEFA